MDSCLLSALEVPVATDLWSQLPHELGPMVWERKTLGSCLHKPRSSPFALGELVTRMLGLLQNSNRGGITPPSREGFCSSKS